MFRTYILKVGAEGGQGDGEGLEIHPFPNDPGVWFTG